jgi:hypothetical protein
MAGITLTKKTAVGGEECEHCCEEMNRGRERRRTKDTVLKRRDRVVEVEERKTDDESDGDVVEETAVQGKEISDGEREKVTRKHT